MKWTENCSCEIHGLAFFNLPRFKPFPTMNAEVPFVNMRNLLRLTVVASRVTNVPFFSGSRLVIEFPFPQA